MINFDNITYILTNVKPEKFTEVIEKADFKSITLTNINEIINIMNIENYRYCYSVEDDRFFEIFDFIEMIVQ